MNLEAPKTYRGQLLLDSGQLSGSFFHRSVILICQHDEQGAFGLVLNRSTDKTVGEMVTADLPGSLKSMPLYLGGPVQTTALSYLHSDEYLPQASVMPNVNLGHALDSLVELGQSFSSTQKIRLFAGYAGWAANQLEGEIERGAWLILPASIEIIFHAEPLGLWRQILRSMKDWKHRLLAEIPDDPSWN